MAHVIWYGTGKYMFNPIRPKRPLKGRFLIRHKISAWDQYEV